MDKDMYIKSLENEIKKLKIENEKLKRDNLTNVYNRHFLDELLYGEYKEKLENNGWFYKIILIDLDDLHNYNRLHGYEAGDKFIVNIINKIKQEIKKQNVSRRIFRLGGDEFVVIYQPYDDLDLSHIDNITIGKGTFSKIKPFREAINEADDEIIQKKKNKRR